MPNSTSEGFMYGHLDTSYKAAGEEEGLKKLCKDFYTIMWSEPEASHIKNMHNEELPEMVSKLTMFLSMWLGGPKDYRTEYKGKSMPQAHKHLIINEGERDAWLKCMDQAVDLQIHFKDDFKVYLKTQFRFPAEMIRKTSKFE